MPEVPDFQEVLLNKARQDLQAAEAMIDNPQVSDEIIGFHSQQAVEKSLKAVLETVRIEYPLTHDLLDLLDLLGRDASACPLTVEDAKRLNPFAVRFRYEDHYTPQTPVPAFDRHQAVRTARLAFEWAKEIAKP